MLHLNIIKVKTPEEMGKAAADEFEACKDKHYI